MLGCYIVILEDADPDWPQTSFTRRNKKVRERGYGSFFLSYSASIFYYITITVKNNFINIYLKQFFS